MMLRLVKEDGPPDPETARQQTVAYTGRLALVTHGEFVKLVEKSGARFSLHAGPHAQVLVVGQQDWAINADGTLASPLREAGPQTLVVSEERFLATLGAAAEQAEPQLYTAATLAEILSLPRARLRAWVRAGLICPAKAESGVMHFDFRQVSAAKLLWDLSQSGVPTSQLRRSLQQLRAWMPDVEQPLEQLTVLERNGRLLVRMETGLAETDGQFQFEFTGEAVDASPPPSMRLYAGPSTAAAWHAQGVEQEQGGYLGEAVESYRQALLRGGPDARICFDLAHALQALGRKPEAAERYRQALELDDRYPDAWNNLGTVLAEMGERAEACTAFGRALAIDPNDLRAHYNLADTLEEMGLHAEAVQHWQAYVRQDSQSPWGVYARSRLS
jgi:tetratricopeptide (TPR) repeat protein